MTALAAEPAVDEGSEGPTEAWTHAQIDAWVTDYNADADTDAAIAYPVDATKADKVAAIEEARRDVG